MFKILFRTKKISLFEKSGGRMSRMYHILLFSWCLHLSVLGKSRVGGIDLSQSCFSYMRLSLYDGKLAAGSDNSGVSFKLCFQQNQSIGLGAQSREFCEDSQTLGTCRLTFLGRPGKQTKSKQALKLEQNQLFDCGR